LDKPRPARKEPFAPPTPAPAPAPEGSSAVISIDSGHATTADTSTPEEEEIAPARRIPAVTLQVWESLLKPRGYTREGDKLVRTSGGDGVTAGGPVGQAPSSSQPKVPIGTQSLQPSMAPKIPAGRSHSALLTFSRTTSFTPRPEGESSKQPFRRAPSLMPGARSSPAPEVAPHPQKLSAPLKPGIFSGVRFRARGEARSASVRGAVEGCGGIWVEGVDDEQDVEIILVRLARYVGIMFHLFTPNVEPSGSALYRAETDEAERAKYRTECWMEACVARGRVCGVDEHVSFVPLGIELPIPGASNVVLSPSGLDVAEDMWVKRLSRALGKYAADI